MSSEERTIGAALVVSMFDQLHEAQRVTNERLNEGNQRMETLEVRLDAVVLNGREQNGNVAKALAWQRDHDQRLHDAQVAADAIAAEKARLVGHVQRVKDMVGEWSVPVLLLGGTLVTLTNIAVAAFWWLR